MSSLLSRRIDCIRSSHKDVSRHVIGLRILGHSIIDGWDLRSGLSMVVFKNRRQFLIRVWLLNHPDRRNLATLHLVVNAELTHRVSVVW